MNKGDVVGAALQVNKEDEEKARLLEALKKHKKEKKQKKKEKRKVNIVTNRFVHFYLCGCPHDRERKSAFLLAISQKTYYFIHTVIHGCENLQVW